MTLHAHLGPQRGESLRPTRIGFPYISCDLILESLQPLLNDVGHRRRQCRLIFQDAQINSCTLCRLDVGDGPDLPSASFGILAGAVDDKKIAQSHPGCTLYGDIVLWRIKEIDLRMLDPEIMHIVRIV